MQGLLDGGTCGDDADKDLEKALKALTKALDDDNWENGSPEEKKGKKVFANEQKKCQKEVDKANEEMAKAQE